MVQVLKEELKSSIIKAAREEFLAKGFTGASMRSVAKKSGVSLSNIYNYFSNKDDIFKETLKDTIEQLESVRERITNSDDSNYLKFDKSEAYFNQIVDFLDTHRENLKLIALCSHGSVLEKYVDDWINEYGSYEYSTLKRKAKNHKEIFNKLPSEFFIKSLSIFFFRAVLELASKNLTRKKLEQHVDEVFSFVYQGWDYYTDF